MQWYCLPQRQHIHPRQSVKTRSNLFLISQTLLQQRVALGPKGQSAGDVWGFGFQEKWGQIWLVPPPCFSLVCTHTKCLDLWQPCCDHEAATLRRRPRASRDTAQTTLSLWTRLWLPWSDLAMGGDKSYFCYVTHHHS